MRWKTRSSASGFDKTTVDTTKMESLQHTQYTPFDADIANKRIVNVQHIIHFTFTGNDPRKGKRIPLNEINYNEQRDALRLNP